MDANGVPARELLETAWLTVRVASLATGLILVPGVALGYVLSRGRFPGRTLLHTAVSLPMVLPPVAVGLLLLLVLSRRSASGRFLEQLFGEPLLLTPLAAAIAAAVMSFPLLVLGATRGFDAVPRRLEHVAATLGAGRVRVFLRVTLPLAARGIAYGLVFAFARALGEFGATVLVAGDMPGRTRTLSIAIYARIEEFEDGQALAFALVSIVLALAVTGAAELVLRERGT